MLLTVLSVPECPNAPVLVDRLRRAVGDRPAELDVILIENEECARRWGMRGSPTLLLNGEEPFPADGIEGSLSCRLHRAADGSVAGAPSVAELEAVIAASEGPAPKSADHGPDALDRAGRGRLAPAEHGLRAVQQAALWAMAQSGRAPRPVDLDPIAAPYGRGAAQVLAELAAGDFLALDERDEIRVLYPFSMNPSRHLVRIDGGPRVWAMCAIDALGIAAMLGRAVSIETTDPLTTDPITVRVDETGTVAAPPESVVLLGRRGEEGPAAQICCDAINVFTSRHSAARWAALHPEIAAQTMDLPAATHVGRAIFGDLLTSP